MNDEEKREELLEALLQRAQAAKLKTESINYPYGDEVMTYHHIFFPEGKGERRIGITSPEKSEALLSIEFERFGFLGDYDAIFDLETGRIEAAISSRDQIPPSYFRKSLGFNEAKIGDEELEENGLEEQPLKARRPDGVSLEISKSSAELRALTSSRSEISLKIYLSGKRSYDAALITLETVSNALFFHLDLERGIAPSLRKTLRRRRAGPYRRSQVEHYENLKFPEFEYDSVPISLYWYARSARAMPLLQFLAYYQVVEYYFPNFSKLEAVRSARKILKTPTFRVDKESDITKLISAISSTGRAGGERDQMKTAVLEVLTQGDIDQYFKENEEVAQIVSKRQKSITEKSINLGRKDHDHRLDLAEMLYDIRCRIVHTKNDFGDAPSEMLLPFSAAEEQLWPYIDLMKLVAQNALIRSSSSLRSI